MKDKKLFLFSLSTHICNHSFDNGLPKYTVFINQINIITMEIDLNLSVYSYVDMLLRSTYQTHSSYIKIINKCLY